MKQIFSFGAYFCGTTLTVLCHFNHLLLGVNVVDRLRVAVS